MSQDYQGWVIAAIVALVGAVYFWLRDPPSVQEVTVREKAPAEQAVVRTRVAASTMSCARRGETIEMQGEVLNTGTTRSLGWCSRHFGRTTLDWSSSEGRCSLLARMRHYLQANAAVSPIRVLIRGLSGVTLR